MKYLSDREREIYEARAEIEAKKEQCDLEGAREARQRLLALIAEDGGPDPMVMEEWSQRTFGKSCLNYI